MHAHSMDSNRNLLLIANCVCIFFSCNSRLIYRVYRILKSCWNLFSKASGASQEPFEVVVLKGEHDMVNAAVRRIKHFIKNRQHKTLTTVVQF